MARLFVKHIDSPNFFYTQFLPVTARRNGEKYYANV